jgi:hypothetical protein
MEKTISINPDLRQVRKKHDKPDFRVDADVANK